MTPWKKASYFAAIKSHKTYRTLHSRDFFGEGSA